MPRPADAASPTSTSTTTALHIPARARPLELTKTSPTGTRSACCLWRGPADNAEREARRISARMVHDVARHQSRRLVEVSAAGVQVPVEAREVGARHLDPDAVARREPVARRHRLQHYLIYAARLHEHL